MGFYLGMDVGGSRSRWAWLDTGLDLEIEEQPMGIQAAIRGTVEAAEALARLLGEIRSAHPDRSPDLAVIGIDAAQVEDVIITHLHYDHAGTVGDFPKARFYLQDREMAFATGRNMAHKTFNVAFALDYVVDMIAKVYDNRVVFVDGTMDVAPGVSVHHVGGHTDGLQIVRVWTERGWVVLASDAAHYYMNMETPNPFPLVYNIGDMLDAYQTMESLADGHQNIVPGHDPLVLQRYPAPFRAAEGIVVRLNVDPVQ